MIHGTRFNHPRLQLCEEIAVNLKAGADLREWVNKFSCAVSPHLTKILFFNSSDEYDTNIEFPLLKLSEKDATAFISSTLTIIESGFFDNESPVTYLACQIAKLNKVKIDIWGKGEKDP